MNPYSKYDLKRYFESIPHDTMEHNNRLQEEKSEAMYQEFFAAMNDGMCFLCNRPNTSFFPKRFCRHWFLYPPGIRKKHFTPHLNGELSFFNLDAYLRWIANYEEPIVCINDLVVEKSKTSYIETTIRYKNIEWAFSVGHTDKAGHQGGRVGSRPHYHLQMKVDGQIFLKFNDFHIEFTDNDLFFLELRDQVGDAAQMYAYRGEGISIIEDEAILEYLAEHSTVADDASTAPFLRHTMMEAPEGKKISGSLIADAAEESKRTKEPIGKILKRLMPDATIETVLDRGDAVPDMVKRSGKK
jgi:hypothetical protein